MAVILSTRTLRREPFGDSIGISAPAGAKVDILDQRDDGWCLVKIPSAPGQPEGWVTALAVDAFRDALDAIDKLVFTEICAWDSLIVETSAHYLVAVAELRTDIVDGAIGDDGDWGPFSLRAEEWNEFCSKPELGIAFSAGDRKDYIAQCMVFAVMANFMQKRLAAKLSDQPTVKELYLAQVIGSTAAHNAFSKPTATIDQLLAAVDPQELKGEGIVLGRKRDKDMLGGKTAKQVLDQLEISLQKALDNTRHYVTKVNAQLLASLETRLAPDGLPSLEINFDSSPIPPARRNIAILIAKRFQESGYGSIQQIAAIANAIAESSLNPSASGDGGKSHGLFQLNQNGGVGSGHSTTVLKDPEKNIAIMLNHMATEEKTADASFRSTVSILDAITIFVRRFERPADTAGAIATRVAIAQKLVI